MTFDNYWNESWAHSSYPTEGEKWVYLIAGIRNIRSVEVHDGLWANVGEGYFVISSTILSCKIFSTKILRCFRILIMCATVSDSE